MAATAIAKPAKDLTGLSGAEFKRDGRLGLQPGDGAAQLQHGLGLVHDVALVDEVLEPVVRGFDLARHVRQLQPDDGVIDEFLAKSLALVCVFDGFLVADAGEADALDDDADSLVVEVGHDYFRSRSEYRMTSTDDWDVVTFESLVLLANQILNRNFNVFESDIRSSA